MGLPEKLLFNEPSYFVGYSGFLFYLQNRDAIVSKIKDDSIEMVIISGPPFSLFHFAPFIKSKIPGVPIILDYRDPWNINHSSLIAKYFERKILHTADFIVLLNEPMKLDIISYFDINKNKCEVILNGYSEQDWREFEKKYNINQKKNSKLTISYIGSISFECGSYRYSTEFFHAIEDFPHKEDIIIRFVGSIPSSFTNEFQKRYPNLLEIIPPVATQESYKYMLESDVLLVLHTRLSDSKYMLTGKFFDYIRSGKPIFGIGATESAYFIKIIKNLKLGITSGNRSDEILIVRNKLYKKWEDGNLNEIRMNDIDITNYSREYQNKTYLNIINRLDDLKRNRRIFG